MASTNLKIPVIRTNTPVIPSHSKPAISLEEWEAKAPLSEIELKSVAIFQNACGEKPLPLKTLPDEAAASRPASPTPNRKAKSRSPSLRPETPVLGGKQHAWVSRDMRPGRPVQTAQEFYDWFSMIERSVAHSQESHYREYLGTVVKHLETCDGLVGSVDDVQREVDGMLDGWRSVEAGGKSLKDACEQLLDERDRLIKLTEDIGDRLEYFQELEHATRMLNHPGESLVLQADFLDMVERVDICIDFLRANRHYYEAEIYYLRFQQCLTRAMTLIKMYFVGSLKALATDIARRMSDKEVSQTAQMHLLYTRFQSVAAQVAPLLGELERRTWSHPEELSSLLSECHSAYFGARKSLLVGRLAEEIKGLDPGRADLVELTRTGCSYLKQLCIDEFAIYRCFFDSGKELLYAYLESLCDYLYDDLRPRILHEPRLSVLCDVCKVLQALMVLDVPETEPSSDDEEDAFHRNGTSSREAKQGLGKLHISHMLQSVLQDAQTRLFFKAQTVVQAEIRYYVPKADDLDYPKKLEGACLGQSSLVLDPYRLFKIGIDEAQRRPKASDIKERQDETYLLRISSFDKRETWYATLRTAVAVLAQLHDFVQPSIFDDIAQEAIDFCRLSLVSAANLITVRGSPSTETDAQLFLIKHLLVLKEMTINLNLASKDADGPLELRHVTDTLKDMLRTTNLIPYAFATSLPKARDEASIVGTKELFARTATQPINDFMMLMGATDWDAKTAPPTRAAALDVEAAFLHTLEVEVPAAAQRLRLYLADSEGSSEGEKRSRGVEDGESANKGAGTVGILLGHVQDRIVDAYVMFRKATEFMPADGENDRPFASSPDEIRSLFKTLA
ncbi:Sec34-domain-containing protein [Phellopilus nigrolimitatus]|nr:Sec34-domain-containing protein [Phellopilus nigrolimitatus]